MYKSFKFVLFNGSFQNPAKFEIRPNFGQICKKKGRILSGAGAELRYSPNFWLLIDFCVGECSTQLLVMPLRMT